MDNIKKTLKNITRTLFVIGGFLVILVVFNDIYKFFIKKEGIVYNFKYGHTYGFIFLLLIFLTSINLIIKTIGYKKLRSFFKKKKINNSNSDELK